MLKRIMIVDDETHMRDLIGLILKRRGFEILPATGAREALDLLRGGLPDLFIVDVVMPRVNGFDLCRQLRKRADTANIPIIMLSADNDREVRIESYRCGADAFVPKLTPHRDLIERIREILHIEN